MSFSAAAIRITEIHDLNLDHEVGGQDLPFLVSVACTGDLDRAIAFLEALVGLGAFNVRPGLRYQGHDRLEFLTFEARATVERIFGASSETCMAAVAGLNANATTVGALRLAIRDLPDEFPVIQTRQGVNVSGVNVLAGVWRWRDEPGLLEQEGLALRLD